LASAEPSKHALRDAAIGLASLAILRLLISHVSIPPAAVVPASVLASFLFVGISVATLFRAAAFRWTWGTAIAAVLIGVPMQFGLGFAANAAGGLAASILHPIAQTGLLVWCLGLGAMLCLALRGDRNLLVPVAIFLALFDIWLVFVPEGPVGQIARGNQAALAQVAFTVPAPTHAPTGAKAHSLAYIGPADFLFMSMFFVALYRFGLRARETAIWMAPVLVLYLLVALMFPHVSLGPIRLGALPALVPIGLVLLAVNAREFRLSRDEKITSWAVLVIGIALVAWRFSVQPTSPVEPSPSEDAQGLPESGGSPAPKPEGRSPSPIPTAP